MISLPLRVITQRRRFALLMAGVAIEVRQVCAGADEIRVGLPHGGVLRKLVSTSGIGFRETGWPTKFMAKAAASATNATGSAINTTFVLVSELIFTFSAGVTASHPAGSALIHAPDQLATPPFSPKLRGGMGLREGFIARQPLRKEQLHEHGQYDKRQASAAPRP